MFQSQEEQEITGVPFTEAIAFHQAFEERNAQVLFKQNHSKKIKLYLEEVILLDSQSTMDLFCNPKLVNNIYKSVKNMQLTSNGGTMKVNHKASMKGYKQQRCLVQQLRHDQYHCTEKLDQTISSNIRLQGPNVYCL
jgi:hypothetical protein